ncbi:RTA-like protein [Podospora aff. communis PSN243]|uniref:RTA-like protein n=1 Tax=Podospora aff. communis PSN243 TaxID=3040156 RepID=A0AAV9GDM3_9PEZI|nr:RTA-like protein [Podospora aff. communis PSN243]
MAYQPYKYDPSLPAAVVFAIAFGASTTFHAYQLARWRTWYFLPFLVGGLFSTLGYILRGVSISEKPDYSRPTYIIQTVLILLAPALYAASIYMILGRIMILLGAESYAFIKRSLLTKIFVAADVVSFVVQAIGGALISSADTTEEVDRGKAIIVVGLFLQIIFFSLFISVTAVFHRRILSRPTRTSQEVSVPWRRYILVLYAVSVLIMVRSIFRVAEFIQGPQGTLMTNEVYLYVFDTVLMFFVSVVFNVYHPSTIIDDASWVTIYMSG